MNNKKQNYIGTDVAKETPDTHRFPDNLSQQFTNSPEGWQDFLNWFRVHKKLVGICNGAQERGAYAPDFAG